MADFPTPPFYEAPARGNPLEFRDETYPAKTYRGMGLPYGENFIILHPCDRWTDGRTDRGTGYRI